MRRARALKIAAAYGLDCLLGDPEGYPHPVRIMGKGAHSLAAGLGSGYFSGCLLAAMLVSGSWLAARLIAACPGGEVGETLLLYTSLARKDLERSALRVAESLECGDEEEARRHLRALVGRDPRSLDAAGICRASVESVAENLVDGVLTPLFWAALGGAPAALAFKAVSTLDSMVGHRDPAHRRLGWCSARLDDLAVFPAARLSRPLVAAASLLCGKDAAAAARIGIRDRRKHLSPNSAHAEAAFAGALGLGLGGADRYGGEKRSLPEIGDGTRELEPRHVREAVRLLNASSLLGLLLALGACRIRPGGGRNG